MQVGEAPDYVCIATEDPPDDLADGYLSTRAPSTGVFAVPGPSSTNLVYIFNGEWKCTHSMHKKHNQSHMCSCMLAVMSGMHLTAEHVHERLDIVEQQRAEAEQQRKREQEGGPRSIQCPISTQPRTFKHPRHPNLQPYYLPESIVELVQGAGRGEELEQLCRLESPDQVKAGLIELLDPLRCSVHGSPLRLIWQNTRILHTGSDRVVYGHVGMVYCDPPCEGHCLHVYDGAADHIFNACNSDMFTHHALAECVSKLRLSGCSFNAMRQEAVEFEARTDDAQNVPCLASYLNAFFGWLPLLTDLPVVECPLCGTYPFALIVDGMGLSVMSKRLKDLPGFGQPTGATVPATEVSCSAYRGALA